MIQYLVAFFLGVATALACVLYIFIKLLNDYQGSQLPQNLTVDQFTSSFVPKVRITSKLPKEELAVQTYNTWSAKCSFY